MPTIVLSNHYDKEPLEILKSTVPEGFSLITLPEATREELLKAVPEADYLLASGRLKIDSEIIKAAPKLKMIQRTGVGTDSLDFDAAARAGVEIRINGGVNSTSVAEHAVMLMLTGLRRTVELDSQLKGGVFIKQKNGLMNHELSGKTVGLIGFGNIGRRTAAILNSFGAKIMFADPAINAESDCENAENSEMEELLQKADIISLHCGLNDSTRHIIDAKAIAGMKDGVMIINTARGGLVDESALLNALKTGKVGFAGLDAFETEPPIKDGELLTVYKALAAMPNVIMTPHVAGVTRESFEKMMNMAMESIKEFEGKGTGR